VRIPRPVRAVPVVLGLLAACGDAVRIPAPTPGKSMVAMPEPQASVVNLPVTLSLAAVAAQVEDRVPLGQNREDEWRPLGDFPVVGQLYVKEMWQRDPLRLAIHGDHLDVDAHVRYRARIAAHPCVLGRCSWVPLAGCGQEGVMPSVDLGLRTQLAWRADWSIAPHTTPRPVSAPVRCRLTRANVDVTDRVRAMVQDLLLRAAPQVDEKIRDAAQLHRRLEEVWTTVQQPIRAGQGIYVLLQPQALDATPPQGEGTTLGTTVSVVVRPRVMIGEEPEVKPLPLPERTALPPGRGFEVQLVAELPYSAVDEILAQKLAGRKFTVSGHRVRVRRARLYGAGNQVVLAADLTGDARGTVYFVGTPAFDAETQVVSVPDLDFSVESRNLLPQVAGWLLYDQLRDQVRDAAHFDVSDRVDSVRADVDGALNRQLGSSVRMRGGLEQLRPLGVFVFPNALAAVVQATGHAQIRVDVGAADPATPHP
jgi:hypothetical protein